MPINTLSTVDLSQDFPEIKIINPEDFTLLGSPVLPCAAKKCSWKNQKILTERLKEVHEHDALYLLKNCMAIPKLLYFLRSAPMFLEEDILKEYDSYIRKGLEAILNVKITNNIWDKASLPTKMGGLGVRKTTEFSISAYLSSVISAEPGVQEILGLAPFHVAGISGNFAPGEQG